MAKTTQPHFALRDLARNARSLVASTCLLAVWIAAAPGFAQQVEEVVVVTAQGNITITPITYQTPEGTTEVHPDVIEYWEFFRDNPQLWSSIFHHSEKTLHCAPSEEGCEEACECNVGSRICDNDTQNTACRPRVCACDAAPDPSPEAAAGAEPVGVCEGTSVKCKQPSCTCVELECTEGDGTCDEAECNDEEETCIHQGCDDGDSSCFVCKEAPSVGCFQATSCDVDEDPMCGSLDFCPGDPAQDECASRQCQCVEGFCQGTSLVCGEILCSGLTTADGGCGNNPTLAEEVPLHTLKRAQALYAGLYRLDSDRNQLSAVDIPMPAELQGRPGFLSNRLGRVAFRRVGSALTSALTSEWVINIEDNSDCFDDIESSLCDTNPGNDLPPNARDRRNAYLVFAKIQQGNTAVIESIADLHIYDPSVNLLDLQGADEIANLLTTPTPLPVDFDPADVLAPPTELLRLCQPTDPNAPLAPEDPEGLDCRRPICSGFELQGFDCSEPLCRDAYVIAKATPEAAAVARCTAQQLPHFTTLIPEPAPVLLAGAAVTLLAVLARFRGRPARRA